MDPLKLKHDSAMKLAVKQAIKDAVNGFKRLYFNSRFNFALPRIKESLGLTSQSPFAAWGDLYDRRHWQSHESTLGGIRLCYWYFFNGEWLGEGMDDGGFHLLCHMITPFAQHPSNVDCARIF